MSAAAGSDPGHRHGSPETPADSPRSTSSASGERQVVDALSRDDRFVDAVAIGELLFIGAHAPQTVGEPVTAQAQDVTERCVRLVEQAGGGANDLVLVQVFLLDLADAPIVDEELTRRGVDAARSFMQVPALPVDGARLQINGIASIGTSKQMLRRDERTVAIRAGDMVFVGAVNVGRSDVRPVDQTIVGEAAFIFGHICDLFESLGAARTSIGWMQLYLTKIDERTDFTPTRFEILGEHRPGATLVEMSGVGAHDERMAIWAMGSIGSDPHYIDPGSLDERFRTHLSGAIEIGGVVFISGQVALDESVLAVTDVGRAQTAEVLALIDDIVNKAGGRMSDIPWLNVYLTDVGLEEIVRSEVASAFLPHRPTINVVGCSSLVTPRHVVEINAVAVIADADRRHQTRPLDGDRLRLSDQR